MGVFNPFGECDEILRARKRINEMDIADGGSLADFPVDIGLRTVLSALEAHISLRTSNTETSESCFWDAVVMIQQIEFKSRNGQNSGN